MAVLGRSNVIVTLIHGTFAKGARWVQADGTIRRALKAQFGDAVTIEEMEWSGCNTFKARHEAAEKLRAHVQRERGGLEGAKHVVIGHSHAGNIVSYAARDLAVKDRLAAVVTLATPFIVARRRNLGWLGIVMPQALVLLLVLGLIYLTNSLWGSTWSPWQQVGLALALVLLVEIPGLLLNRRWEKYSETLLDQLGHGEILSERILILRAVADEATGGITFIQFPTLATTFLIGKLTRITHRYFQWIERLMKHPIRVLGFCLLVLCLCLPTSYFVMRLTDSELLLWSILGIFWCLTYFPIIFLYLRHQRLALVTISAPIALLVAPIVLILSIISMVFGFRFAIANLYLDLSVEATPIGNYEVTLLSPSCAEDLDTPGSLSHSALYDDQQAVQLICDFIAARII